MNVVDSSGWIEYFTNAPGAEFFAPAVENVHELLVPRICMAEVARYFYRERGIREALHCLAQMEEGRIIEMDYLVMTRAARLAKDYRCLWQTAWSWPRPVRARPWSGLKTRTSKESRG